MDFINTIITQHALKLVLELEVKVLDSQSVEVWQYVWKTRRQYQQNWFLAKIIGDWSALSMKILVATTWHYWQFRHTCVYIYNIYLILVIILQVQVLRGKNFELHRILRRCPLPEIYHYDYDPLHCFLCCSSRIQNQQLPARSCRWALF